MVLVAATAGQGEVPSNLKVHPREPRCRGRDMHRWPATVSLVALSRFLGDLASASEPALLASFAVLPLEAWTTRQS